LKAKEAEHKRIEKLRRNRAKNEAMRKKMEEAQESPR